MSERILQSPPNLLSLYGKAALGAVPGTSALPLLGIGGRSERLPEVTLVLPESRAEPERLAAYCRVCEFTLKGTLPPTYPHMLAFPLQMSLLTEEDFPFGAIGLVHISNSIVQHRPISVGETLELRVRASGLRPHPKGRQFDLVSEARSEGELVWESVSTTLSRGGGSDASEGEEADAFAGTDFDSLPGIAEWKLPSDLGRRYGAVSGDRNPIHMSDLTAKPLGFPKAIAHGMWTKARTLAALESQLPERLEVAVRFKRPILLPGKVAFASAPRDGAVAFAVRDARKATPHVEGVLAPGGD